MVIGVVVVGVGALVLISDGGISFAEGKAENVPAGSTDGQREGGGGGGLEV